MAFARAQDLPKDMGEGSGMEWEGPVRVYLEPVGLDCVLERKGDGDTEW